MTTPSETVAVLCSGGLDSVVLVADRAREHLVQPLYVSVGLAWEDTERAAMDRLGHILRRGACGPVALEMNMRVTPTHWAIRGGAATDTPDEDVYWGRNVILLSKAAVYCASARIHRIAIGPLSGNPFPDATPAFFAAMGRAMSLGLDHRIEVVAPFSAMHKADVIRLGVSLGVPLHLSMSCMNPQGGVHCGLCSKCRERRDAFDGYRTIRVDPRSHESPSPRPTNA